MKINFRMPALVAVAAILCLDGFAQALDNPAFVDGELVIQLKQTARDEHLREALGRANIHAVQGLSVAADNGSAVILAFTKAPVEQAVRALANHPAVDFAEPNWVYQHSALPTEPYFLNGNLWGMGGNYGSQVSTAWQIGHTGSTAIYIGVIDEGVDKSHPDLAGQVSDIYGFDFHHNDGTVYDGGDSDGCTDDHGTHVAGTIGAKGNNGGVVGMNWDVTLISAKFLGPNGGTLANAVKAVNYFTDLKKTGVKVVALNNSWGGGGYSQALHDAIIRAAKQGILFIAAAGNNKSNNDRRASYPANYSTLVGTSTEPKADYDSVISVAAIDSKGAKPSWSNYGATTVDLGAPGVSILSTVPGGTYAYYSGTSMAAPHVTGAIALYAATQSTSTAADQRAALLGAAQATPTTSMNGKTVTGGRLNASGF